MAKPVDWNKVDMLTPGMKNLGNQFNKRWLERDGASDGAIGDYEHSQGLSDHNPDDTSHHNASWDEDSDSKKEIRAIDVDSNLNDPDVNMQDVIDHLRKLDGLEKVIRYMIYNRKMYHSRDGFQPTAYTGKSAHTEHAHFSGAWTQSGDENTSFDFKFDELGDAMPTVKEIWDYALEDPYDTSNPKRKVTAGGWLRYVPSRSLVQESIDGNKAILSALAAIAAKVDLDPSEIQAIKDALAVPTAEQNAQAVVDALGGVDTGTLVSLLREALSPQKLAELKAAL